MSIKNLCLVSIVIPVYNRDKLVKRALESAINQTYKNIEIIVVDNNSTDSTLQVVETYIKIDSRIKLFKNSENIGPVNNWIEGIKRASGNFVKLIFSDDWISDDYIEKTIPHFRDSIGLIFTPAIIHKINNDQVYFQLYTKSRIIDSSLFLKLMLLTYKTPLSPGCGLFRKVDLLNSLSSIINSENHKMFLHYGAGIDVLTYLMTAEKYDNVFFVHDTNAHFLQHDGSFTFANSLDQFYIEAFQYFIKHSLKIKFKSFYTILYKWKIHRIIGYISNRF